MIKIKRVMALALFGCILFTTSMSLVAFAAPSSSGDSVNGSTEQNTTENAGESSAGNKKASQEKYDQLAEALSEKKELEGQLATAKAQVSAIAANKKQQKAKAKEISSKLSGITAQMDDLSSQMEDLQKHIEESKELEEIAQQEVDRQYADMKKRIQYMYENSGNDLAAVLFGGKKFSSILNLLEYIQKVHDYDRDKLDEFRLAKETQLAIINGLNGELAEVEGLKGELKSTQAEFSGMLAKQNALVDEIDDQLEDAEEIQKVYEAEVKAQSEILAQIQADIAREEASVSGNEVNYMSASGFYWPCPGYKRVSSDFGPRKSPTAGASTNHKGIDLAANKGTPILASQSGRVTTATYSSSAGNYIIINHGKNSAGQTVCTVYMHCNSLAVSAGQTVTQGQTIATVGSTGFSTGPHLHFGVTVGGAYVSPWGYVSKP